MLGVVVGSGAVSVGIAEAGVAVLLSAGIFSGSFVMDAKASIINITITITTGIITFILDLLELFIQIL